MYLGRINNISYRYFAKRTYFKLVLRFPSDYIGKYNIISYYKYYNSVSLIIIILLGLRREEPCFQR